MRAGAQLCDERRQRFRPSRVADHDVIAAGSSESRKLTSDMARTDESDRPVAAADQVVEHRERGAMVREADDHVDRIVGEVAGLDHRDACALEQAARRDAVRDARQHDAVGAPADERCDELLLAVERVARIADQRLEPLLAQHRGETGHRGRVDRRGDGRNDEPDEARAAAREAAGDEVGDVARLGDRRGDALAGGLRDLRRLAKRAGDRDRRDARDLGDVDQAGLDPRSHGHVGHGVGTAV